MNCHLRIKYHKYLVVVDEIVERIDVKFWGLSNFGHLSIRIKRFNKKYLNVVTCLMISGRHLTQWVYYTSVLPNAIVSTGTIYLD